MSNFSEAWANLSNYENGSDHFEVEDTHTVEPGAHLAGHKTSFERVDRNVATLLELDVISDTDKTTKELFNFFLKGLLRYVSTIDGLSLARIDKVFDKEKMEEADRARRNAHEAWISTANALSRYCSKVDIDNSWRRVIGLDRSEQTKWALSVAEIARKIALK